jgi:hypothetical protein
LTTPVTAATWHVGEGAFPSLQAAIDEAAPGDTIRIGPGWYPHRLARGEQTLNAYVDKDDLRIIGAGMLATTIGPPDGLAPGDVGIYVEPYLVTHGVAFADLTIANVTIGIYCPGPRLEVRRCRFVGDVIGVRASSYRGIDIQDSRFEGLAYPNDSGLEVDAAPQGILVRGCRFTGLGHGLHFYAPGTLEVDDCEFRENRLGISLHDGANASIRSCEFDGAVGLDLVAASGSVVDCVFATATTTNVRLVRSSLAGSGNVFLGGGMATIHCENPTAVDLHGNHILSSGTPYLLGQGAAVFPPRVLHLERNYWGTDDVDAIEALIDVGPYLQVEVEPVVEEPIPAARAPLGSVKALFH